MAVKLPDFTAVGLDNVYPGNIQPSYPREDPEAEALAREGGALGTLGSGLQGAGSGVSGLAGQIGHQTNLANAALAQMDLHTKLARTEAAIRAETDPQKIDALYSQMQDHLHSSSQLIPDE